MILLLEVKCTCIFRCMTSSFVDTNHQETFEPFWGKEFIMHNIYQGVLKTRAVKNCEQNKLSHAQTPDKESSVEEIDEGSVESDQKVGPAKS